MRSLRLYAPAAILVVGCILVWRTHAQVAMPLDASLTSVLSQLDGYDIHEQTIGEDERRIAGMTSYVSRNYVRDGTLAFATLVSYYENQAQGRTIHSPRNCLPGAGWEILSSRTDTLRVGDASHAVNRYVLKNGRFMAVVYYWYQGRGRVTANEFAVKWNLLRDAAVLGRSEEAFVRVVVPVSSGSKSRVSTDHTIAEDSVGRAMSARLIREVGAVLPKRRARMS